MRGFLFSVHASQDADRRREKRPLHFKTKTPNPEPEGFFAGSQSQSQAKTSASPALKESLRHQAPSNVGADVASVLSYVSGQAGVWRVDMRYSTVATQMLNSEALLGLLGRKYWPIPLSARRLL